jgi:dipeptidyl-peptidase-4
MEDAIMRAGTDLAPANLQGLAWIPSTNDYCYIYKKDKKDIAYVKGSVSSAKTDTLISLQQFNKAVKTAGFSEFSKFPQLTWINKDEAAFKRDTKFGVYHISTGKAESIYTISTNSNNADFDVHALSVAYTIDNNLYITTKDGKEHKITSDADKGIVNGQAAHRREFGIEKGTFWSPTGALLAFYRVDQTMVTDYPLVDISTRPAHDSLMKYPMAGMKSHQATVGIYNIKKGQTVFLNTGEPKEQYLTNITFSPDEKYVYIAVLNREQNHMWMNKYDAASGELVKTLFEEKDDKFVEPLDQLFFPKNNSEEFLWLSQRDGYKHFYLYSSDGKLIRQLTKGNWVVTDFLGFDAAGKNVYFNCTASSPLNRDIYSASLKSGKMTRLSDASGIHSDILNDDGAYLIDRLSNTSTPRDINILSAEGKSVKSLLHAPDPLTDYTLGRTRLFTVKSADKVTDLHCRMILPTNFDSTRKYPVVVYVYGGPHIQLVNNGWLGGSNLWMQLMAERGYIVFTMDSRGSYFRGKAFEQATFRNLGTAELEDQVKGAEYLKSLPYVDTARMGVHGWSFGGFMTTSLMCRYPGLFKVAVAGGPVIDWKYYEVMYTERYMDTPQENPEGYDKADVLNYVKNLKGRLMVIHGTMDDVVVWQHSQMFVKKCVDENKPLDYFIYPGHQHNVLGKDRVHLMNKVSQYFDDFLKPLK